MRVTELVGSSVLVKIQHGGEQAGKIVGTRTEHEASEIETAVNLTLFSVALNDGSAADVLGHYLSRIDNRDYIEASATRPTEYRK